MVDVWVLEPGMKVEQLPSGRVGTVVDWESTSHNLACGCCWEPGPHMVELHWDDNGEWDNVDAEELRLADELNEAS